MRYDLCLILIGFCLPVYASSSGVQARYEISKSGLPLGVIEETYRQKGTHYTLTSITTPLGLMAVFKPGKIIIQSQGLVTRQGLSPLFFADKREQNPEKNTQVEFDWEAKQLTLIHPQQRTTLALPDNTQDRLSALYQFHFLNLDNINSLSFFMTDGRKLDNYYYTLTPQQKLITPAGVFDTLYLDSTAKPGENRTEIWLDATHHLLCKMIITDGEGGQLTQVLSRLKITP